MAGQPESTNCPSTDSVLVSAQKADEKARFDILFETLRDYQQGLLDNTAKTAGFLLLSIGWLVTSETARDTLSSDGRLRGATASAVFLAVTLYAAAALYVYQAAKKIHTRLVELDYVPAEDLDARTISVFTLMLFILANVTIALLLVTIIWRLGP